MNCVICGMPFRCDSRYINEPKCSKHLHTKVTKNQLKQAISEIKSQTNPDGSTTYEIPIEIKSEQQVMGALAANAAEAQKMGASWMLTEFVENGSDAIKQNRKSPSEYGNNFSGTGKIIVEIDDKKLEVRIIDNGTGILDPFWVIKNPFQSMKKDVDYLIGNFGRGLTGFRGLCSDLDYLTVRTAVSKNEDINLEKTGKCVKVSFGGKPKGGYTIISEKEFTKYTKSKTGTVAILKNWIPGQWERLLRDKHKLISRMQLHFGHATKPDNFELIIKTISNKGVDEEKILKLDFSGLQPLFVKTFPTSSYLGKRHLGDIKFCLYKTTPDDSRTFKEPYLLIKNRPLQDSKVCDLPALKDSNVWTSKYLTGYVECDYLRPNQLRNAIDLDENERIFIKCLHVITKDIDKELADYIKALNVKGRDDEFKEIRDTFQEYLRKNKIPFNLTAFKMSGKLSQGASGKLGQEGKLSAKEGGANEGLIAEDDTDIALISREIQKHKPPGPPTGIPVIIKDPKSKNGVIPLKNGHSQKIVHVNPTKTSRGGVKKKTSWTGPNFVPQKHEKIQQRLSWYEPSIKAVVVNSGHEVYQKFDKESQKSRSFRGGFSKKMKRYLMERYAWEFFMEFSKEDEFKKKAFTFFTTFHNMSFSQD